MILSHIKKQFFTVAHGRQNSFDYQGGQIMFVSQGAGGFYGSAGSKYRNLCEELSILRIIFCRLLR